MSKVRSYDIPVDEKRAIVSNFFHVVDQPKKKSDTVDFFVGLFTQSEMIMMSRRVQVAQSFLQDKTYEEIREEIGVSYQTIQKIDQWLHTGDVERDKKLRTWLLSQKPETKKDYYLQEESMLDKYAHHRVIKELFNKLS